MLIKRRSPFSGKENERDIPVNDYQMKMWMKGTPIQIAMPNVSADDREFIMTGITPEEWDNMFNEDNV